MRNPNPSRIAAAGPFGLVPSDAAKRMSDQLTLHYLADPKGNVGKWCAFRLSDGGTDGVLYDDPRDAAANQLHYRQCAYVPVRPGSLGPRECEVVLAYHRYVYDLGNMPPAIAGMVLRTPITTDWMHRVR